MKDEKQLSGLLNYNMAEERMVIEVDGSYRYSKDPGLIKEIRLEKRIFIPLDNAFYEILSTGPATFYLQNKCYTSPKATDMGYGAKSQSLGPTEYKRLELTPVVYQYGDVAYITLPSNYEVTPASAFWVNKNNKMEKFNTKKQFLKIFPEKEPELKEFINKENINMKSREDIIKLGNYCNEILNKK